ncbi:MAG: prepilin-type N-terminal cleavage/methylation domain-containing protein [Gemmatimonadota bacterium]
MVGAARSGFTLVETLIALVLSTFVIGLATHAFLVQNSYYSTQTLQAEAQDNARAATQLLGLDIRTVAEDGIVTAGARTLTLRTPIATAIICNKAGAALGDVQTPGGEAGLYTPTVAGLALRNDSTWEYAIADWSTLNGSDAGSASACASAGADTVGASAEFHRLASLSSLFSTTPAIGDVVMLFRETTYSFELSALDSVSTALYRTPRGFAPLEFVTGMDSTAQFQYRVAGTSTYVDTVPSASVASIDAIRVIADARKRAASGGLSDVTFGLTTNITLRQVR